MKGFTFKKSGLILLAGLFVIGMVSAATQQNQMNQSSSNMTNEQQMQQKNKGTGEMWAQCEIPGRAGALQSVDDLIGTKLQNKQAQSLGRVKQLILNDSRQAVDYVVMKANGKLYPVPWNALGTGRKTYTLDISEANLANAPTVNSLDSNQFQDPAFKDKINTFYKEQVNAQEEKNMVERAMDWTHNTVSEMSPGESAPMTYTAKDIIGYKIQDLQGEDIGKLSDIVFDVRKGNLAYGLVSFGGVMGVGAKTAAVPWDAMQLEPTYRVATLQVDRSMLNDTVLKKGNISQLTDPMFAFRVHQDFNQEPYWEVYGYMAPAGAAMTPFTLWQPDSMYNLNFNPNTIRTMQGTIEEVSTFTPGENAAEGLELQCKTQDGRNVTVYAGPKTFYDNQKIRFEKDDQVTITGSQTMVDGKGVIMATQIKKGSETLKLRNASGKPEWNTNKLLQMMNQQNQTQQNEMM